MKRIQQSALPMAPAISESDVACELESVKDST